ncbi:MAG: hypothetical protein Q8R60_08770 [Mycobacteriales bacterium]|nr:hypothetical protein [Mycobacteriales bacterium]
MRQLAVLVGSFVAVFGFLAIVVLGLVVGALLVRGLGGGTGLRQLGSVVGSVSLSVGWVLLMTRGWRWLRDSR